MQGLTLGDVVKATRGRLVSGLGSDAIGNVSTDSRNLARSEFFVPLVGKRFDGHSFLPEILGKGASGCLMAETWKDKPAFLKSLPRDFGAVEVADTNAAYGDIGNFYRRSFSALSVVGITGSNGKSTTKEMIAAVLAKRFPVLKNKGTLNNTIGVPQTLLALRPDHRVAVLEMGTSLPGEIALLAAIAEPDVGVLTNVGPSHMEFFGDLDGVAQEKGALAEGLKAGGLYAVNTDDPRAWATRSRTKAGVLGFGFSGEADVAASAARCDAGGRWSFDVRITQCGQVGRISLAVMGKQNVSNALAAIAVGSHYGLNLKEMGEALEEYRGLPMRMESLTVGNIHVINDAYNSNPQSLARLLETLREVRAKGKKIVVLGDMLELGSGERLAHEEAGEKLVQAGVDVLIAVGSRARWAATAFSDGKAPSQEVRCFEDAAEAGAWLKQWAVEGDLVLLKGSRGMRLEKILDAMQPLSAAAAGGF